VAARRAGAEERLHAVVELGKRGTPPAGQELRPFLRDKVGIVAAAAARLAGEHDVRDVEKDLEEAFARFLVQPVKSDPGCRAKLAVAEALRKLEVRAPDVYLRGIMHRQPEPSFGPPIDTAAPLRVCCAAALLETRHPLALLEVAPLLADPEANARAGVASVLGAVGGEACEALLRLKVRSGDREPQVMGACLQGLLAASFERGFSFVVGAMKESGDDDVVRMTLLALGEARDERALPLLREYVETSVDEEVRAAAMLAMSVSRLPPATAYLVSLVEEAGERRALEAISALESQRFDSALVERLRAIAESRGGAVREAFLRKMGGG
jgi:HEAT repeat protein